MTGNTLGELKSGLHLSLASAKRQKTVIVTGGAGFLGSRLCEELLKRDDRVICVDNLFTGSYENLGEISGKKDFTVVKHDIVNPLRIDEDIDEIYNLACPASPPKYQIDPIYTFRTSVLGALNMLELAREKGARILQASTSEVYGDPQVHPQPEDYWGNVNPFGPRSCYDEGKRAAETLFHDYHERHGVVIKIARIFNTYGPNMSPSDGRVVSNFIVQALQGEAITIYGSGEQTRSFCYRDDLIDGLIRLMASPEDISRPVNLGNPGEFTVCQLAELVISKTNSRSKTVFRDSPADDPRRRRPDITFARKTLGWEPKVSLSSGLDRTIPYFAAFQETCPQELAQI